MVQRARVGGKGLKWGAEARGEGEAWTGARGEVEACGTGKKQIFFYDNDYANQKRK